MRSGRPARGSEGVKDGLIPCLESGAGNSGGDRTGEVVDAGGVAETEEEESDLVLGLFQSLQLGVLALDLGPERAPYGRGLAERRAEDDNSLAAAGVPQCALGRL